MSVFSGAQPLLTTLLEAVLLGRLPTAVQLLGSGAVLAGLYAKRKADGAHHNTSSNLYAKSEADDRAERKKRGRGSGGSANYSGGEAEVEAELQLASFGVSIS